MDNPTPVMTIDPAEPTPRTEFAQAEVITAPQRAAAKDSSRRWIRGWIILIVVEIVILIILQVLLLGY